MGNFRFEKVRIGHYPHGGHSLDGTWSLIIFTKNPENFQKQMGFVLKEPREQKDIGDIIGAYIWDLYKNGRNARFLEWVKISFKFYGK